MANSHTTPNNLSNHSFINNSTNYGHFTPSYPVSPLDRQFPQPFASTSRSPLNDQENASMDVLNYPGSRLNAQREQALRQTEAENSRLRQQLLVLETEKLDRQNQDKYNHTPKKARTTNVIRHLAHGFAISTFLWINEKASVVCKATISPNFDATTRHSFTPADDEASKAHKLDVFLWELEQYLPDEYKHYQTEKKTMEMFLAQMQACRSDLQHLVRNNATTLLSEFSQLLPSDAEDVLDPARRASNTRFRDLLAFDPNPTPPRVSYPLAAPIIDTGGPGGLFQTDNIRKFLVILLFGKSQLSASSGIPAMSKTCNAAHWKITAVTPNMVSIAATMLRYMLSPDRAFTAVGATSYIDWLSQYSQYQRFLIQDVETPGITSLLENLNAQLFGGQRSRPRPPLLLLENSIPAEDDSLRLAFASIHAASASEYTSSLLSSSAPASTPAPVQPLSTVDQPYSPISAPLFGFPSSTSLPPANHGVHSSSQSSSRSSQPQEQPARSEEQVNSTTIQALQINLIDMNDGSQVGSGVGQDEYDDELLASIEASLSASSQTAPVSAQPLVNSTPLPASSVSSTSTSTNNLNLLVDVATTAQEQLSIPFSTGRATRGAAKRVYEDPDENGDLEPETTPKPKTKKPKKTPAGASVGNEKGRNGNGAGRGRGGRGRGRGASNGTGRGR